MDSNKVFIGVAWPYVNGDIHIGHLAGYIIPCDIFARYSRLKGRDVLMVSGADCHGTPITVEADKRGISASELIKEYIPKVNELIKQYGITYDIFTTTTTENHKRVTQDQFLNLLKNGFISKRKSQQYYSEQDKKFLPDRYVEGECPHCHAKDQRADQCEVCGRTIGLGELINPHSKLTKAEVALKETEHYFIDFDKLEPEIKEFVLNHEEEWKSWVWAETMGFLNEGLQPRAITRDLDWGVEIPKDKIPEDFRIENIEQKRFYVWFDAVIGYLSAAIEYCDANGLNVDDYWKNPECKHYYFMGQDNLTFHTIFWPGQLIGQRLGYNLPYFPSIVKFLNANGAKLSKSRGNIIDAKKLGDHFNIDVVRFYISSILPENKESNWDWNDFKQTVNGDLNGNIGNFIHRVSTFYKNKLNSDIKGSKPDAEVIDKINEAFKSTSAKIEVSKFVEALEDIKKLSSFGNQYFDHKKPWELLKTDVDECAKVINSCLQIVNALRILLAPFVPEATNTLSGYFNQTKAQSKLGEDNYEFKLLDTDNLKISDDIKPLFSKIEDEQIEEFNK